MGEVGARGACFSNGFLFLDCCQHRQPCRFWENQSQRKVTNTPRALKEACWACVFTQAQARPAHVGEGGELSWSDSEGSRANSAGPGQDNAQTTQQPDFLET